MDDGNQNQKTSGTPPEVFVCYSKNDGRMLDEFLVSCSPYVDARDFKVWTDRELKANQDWKQEILSALERADVFVILVSQSLLATKFVKEEEFIRIFESRTKGNSLLFWMLLNACAYKKTPLGKIQAISGKKFEKPLDKMKKADRLAHWNLLAEDIANEALKVSSCADKTPKQTEEIPKITPSIEYQLIDSKGLSKNFGLFAINIGVSVQLYQAGMADIVITLPWDLPGLNSDELNQEITERPREWKILHEQTEKILHPLSQLNHIFELAVLHAQIQKNLRRKSVEIFDHFLPDIKNFDTELKNLGTTFCEARPIQQLSFLPEIVRLMRDASNQPNESDAFSNALYLSDFALRQARSGLQLADSVLKTYFDKHPIYGVAK